MEMNRRLWRWGVLQRAVKSGRSAALIGPGVNRLGLCPCPPSRSSLFHPASQPNLPVSSTRPSPGSCIVSTHLDDELNGQ